MNTYLLLSRSITHAQRMSRTLERSGITARFFRPPMGQLTDRGCAYAVRIAEKNYPTAMERLRVGGLSPMRVYYAADNGTLSEISF